MRIRTKDGRESMIETAIPIKPNRNMKRGQPKTTWKTNMMKGIRARRLKMLYLRPKALEFSHGKTKVVVKQDYYYYYYYYY